MTSYITHAYFQEYTFTLSSYYDLKQSFLFLFFCKMYILIENLIY